MLYYNISEKMKGQILYESMIKNKFINFVGEHEKLWFLFRCVRRMGDPKFIHDVVHLYDDPLVLRMEQSGNENIGLIIGYLEIDCGHGGFFAIMRMVMDGLYYAYVHNIAPIVNLVGECTYREREIVYGTTNVWEYYFEQYEGLSFNDLENCYRKTDILPEDRVLAENKYHSDRSQDRWAYSIKNDYIKEMGLVYRKYVKFNERVQSYIEESMQELNIKEKKTLGVHIHRKLFSRGVQDHPIVADMQEYIDFMQDAINNKNFEQIFVATDESDTVEMLKEIFGEVVVCYTDVFRNEEGFVVFSEDNRELHHYRLGLEVLRDMYTLACCDGLLSGLSNVSNFARIVNASFEETERYKYMHIFDLGVAKEGLNDDEVVKEGRSKQNFCHE